MKSNEWLVKSLFWVYVIAVISIGSFFIVYNAQWIIGDDYEIIRKTGSGLPFKPSDTVKPAIGRFFPTAYLVYDVLLLFFDGYISPKIHYGLQALFFVCFVVSMSVLLLMSLKKLGLDNWWRCCVSAFGLLLSVCVVYPHYLECFSTIWCGYSIVCMFMASVYLFHETEKWIWGITALILVNYFCYGCENLFVVPLSLGAFALCFQRKTMSKKEKMFDWLLVSSGVLYLLLYSIIVLPNIESAYDGSHGDSASMLGNAIQMFKVNYLLVLVVICSIARVVDVLKNKKRVTYFDGLLFAALASCCANFVLRLNWPLYYKISVTLSIPALVYYSVFYIGRKWVTLVLLILVLVMGGKDASFVKKNQRHRIDTFNQITKLSNKIDESKGVFWYAPNYDDVESFNLTIRDWKYKTICTYLGWLRHEPEFALIRKTEFHCDANTIWVNPLENKLLFPEDSTLVKNGVEFFYADGFQSFWVENCN